MYHEKRFVKSKLVCIVLLEGDDANEVVFLEPSARFADVEHIIIIINNLFKVGSVQ